MDTLADSYYRQITAKLEEKSSLEEVQMSRRQRYFQRSNRPKPDIDEFMKKKKRRLCVKDDSDDEMPAPTPKIKRKKAAPKEKEVEVIVLDADDQDIFSAPTTPSESFSIVNTSPTTCRSPPAMKTPKKTENKKEKCPRSESSTVVKESTAASKATEEDDDEPPLDPLSNRLRGRLPPWYHARKAKQNELRLKNLEKKEERLKLEEEMEKKRIEEEKLEIKRKRDRERRREKTILKRIGDGVGVAAAGEVDLEKIRKENNAKLDEKLRKKRADVKHKITDPSMDPSQISLGAPETVPWAKRNPPGPKKTTSDSPSLPSTSSSPPVTSLNDLLENLDMAEFYPSPTTSTLPTDPFADPFHLLGLDEGIPLYFNETDEVFALPEEEEIEEVVVDDIDENFLNIINDDSILCDPVLAFNHFY